MIKYTFSDSAREQRTDKQRESLLDISKRFKAHEARISTAFDLPTGYIEFVLLDAKGEKIINGGISPEGVVST